MMAWVFFCSPAFFFLQCTFPLALWSPERESPKLNRLQHQAQGFYLGTLGGAPLVLLLPGWLGHSITGWEHMLQVATLTAIRRLGEGKDTFEYRSEFNDSEHRDTKVENVLFCGQHTREILLIV